MKYLKRILSLFLCVLIFSFGQMPFVYAQDASVSAVVVLESSASAIQASASATTTILPEVDVPDQIASPASVLQDDNILRQDTEDRLLYDIVPTISPSATLKKKSSLRAFSRKDYRADERINVVVDNGIDTDSKLEVFDASGVQMDVGISTISVSDPLVYRLSPPRAFRPGRFRLVYTTVEDETMTQDFTWGVLAINSNKSIYVPNEVAHFSLAVLDETGQMACDAILRLEIKAPDGQIITKSTQDGSIIINPECQIKGYVEKPDYETTYTVGGVGAYTLFLSATTKNGEESIHDGFDVREEMLFDIERKSATRLFPPVHYPMEIAVTASEDFTGTVEETVPGIFAISQYSGVVQYDSLVQETISSAEDIKEAQIPLLSMPTDLVHPISQMFGDQLRDPLVKKKYADYGLLGHDGVDFDVPQGSAVLAVDDGIVVKADVDGDYGSTVVIQHAWGKSYYGHLSTITAQIGKKQKKGYPIGVSGSTGLSTGPHLHFGIKANVNEEKNGYYGKINPLPYLSFQDSRTLFDSQVAGIATSSAKSVQMSQESVQNISWNVSLKKGETVHLGYTYQVPNISPQFYVLGPMTIRDSRGVEVFQSIRPWQLAVDVEGSGANTVSPTTGTISTTGNTYTFTFDPAESMSSGGITITVPSGWSAPQGTAGVAGYTAVTGAGLVGRVLWTADSGGAEDDGDMCASTSNDTTTVKEGSAAFSCVNTATAPDSGDSFSYDFTPEDWTNYTSIGYWFRTVSTFNAFKDMDFGYDNTTSCASPLQTYSVGATTANTWTYKQHALSVTRTDVAALCWLADATEGNDSNTVWVDDVIIGPGVPTFSGSGPWTISIRYVSFGATDTSIITYGSGAGASGVTNSSSAGVHTFTTQSRISSSGTLTNIASSPTITLSGGGPTIDQLLRHGAWFDAGVEQPFTF